MQDGIIDIIATSANVSKRKTNASNKETNITPAPLLCLPSQPSVNSSMPSVTLPFICTVVTCFLSLCRLVPTPGVEFWAEAERWLFYLSNVSSVDPNRLAVVGLLLDQSRSNLSQGSSRYEIRVTVITIIIITTAIQTSCFLRWHNKLKWAPFEFFAPSHYCKLGAGSIPFRAIVNKKNNARRGGYLCRWSFITE